MRCAIVDLGTNTFNLLIADITEESFSVIHKEKQAVKLGKSGLAEGEKKIQPDAIERGLKAMKHYANVVSSFSPDKTIAIATSALRDASNSSLFIDEVKAQTGIQIQVISGEEEARLIAKGVEQTLHRHVKNHLIMDVGGGSTEFIIVKDGNTVWSRSYDLGVSRLLDWLKPSDPITSSEIQKLQERITSELEELFEQVEIHEITTLVGSSGSFDSIHDMIHWVEFEKFTSDGLDFNEINLEEYTELHNRLVDSTLEERANWPGLVAMRVDMVVIATLEIFTVIHAGKLDRVYRSAYALKEGILKEQAEKNIGIKIG